MYPVLPIINVVSKIIKNIEIFPIKFSAEKILCILHRQVFVMGFPQLCWLSLYNQCELSKSNETRPYLQ